MMWQAFVKDALRKILEKTDQIIGTQESFDNRLIDIENTLIDLGVVMGKPAKDKKLSVADKVSQSKNKEANESENSQKDA